ncbi:MAG: plastocyanin [Elainellaceae cyanobacterium]
MQSKTLFQKLGILVSVLLVAIATVLVPASPAAAETYEIKMGADNGQLAFVPNELTVSPGDTVNFVLNKLAPHNVVFDKTPAGVDSASLSAKNLLFAPGESATVSIPADAPSGTYSFYCTPHRGAGMVGKLNVQ